MLRLLYRLILRLYPAELRREHGAEMESVFLHCVGAEEQAHPRVLWPIVWWRGLIDALAFAWTVRFRSLQYAGDTVRPGDPGTRGVVYMQDVRTTFRRLRRSPMLSCTVVALLALTVGSATLVFTVVNAVLLRPLPYSAPDRIALVWETRGDTTEGVVGAHEYPEWERSNTTFDAMAPMIYNEGVHLTGAGDPMALLAVRVSSRFFPVMGVSPAIGRAFSSDEDVAGRGEVVILSDRLWRSRFGADPGVIGRAIVLNDRPFQIVGVMPPSFAFPVGPGGVTPDVWTPVAENIEGYVGRHYVFVVGRVKPSVTMAQAEADLSRVATTLAARYPDNSGGHGVRVVPLRESLVKDVRPSLVLLAGAVGCLLLIGCSNVASLLMARGLARRREIALEQALGASRGRLIRQLFAESLALSSAGGALGVVLAYALVRVVPSLVPPGTLTTTAITIDASVLAFAAGVSIATGLIFGVAPALQARRIGPAEMIRHGGRALVGGHTRARRVLVTAQVALAVLLVVGATLMVRGLVALQRVDPGFDTAHTMAVDISLRGEAYAPAHRRRAFFDDVEDRIARMPGVAAVGSVSEVPLGESVNGVGIGVEGAPDEPGERGGAEYRVVTHGYFGTIGVPFIAGRDFRPSDARVALPLIRWYPQQPLPAEFDRPQAAPVAIINESMARRFWPDTELEDVVGRRFNMVFSPWITVIGVVRDMRTVSLRTETGPEFYLAASQEPQASMSLLVRTSGDPVGLAPAVRAAVRDVDATLPISSVRTMDEVAGSGLARPRFMSVLLGTFAAVALLLMTIGVYGLLAFTTAQRLPEMGIRAALGATRRQLHVLVLRDAIVMTAAGVLVGALAAVALGRLIADQIFGVAPTDPLTFASVIGLVVLIVGLACWRPVRRAGRVDPAVTLRAE